MNTPIVSTDKSLLNIELIHSYLCDESYWARGIPLDTVRRSIANSICFGLYLGGEMIGFSRVTTDKATFAYLGDVFVLAPHQHKGYGKLMMQEAMQHPDLQGLRRWCLLTADAHSMYRNFGWKDLADPSRWMELHNPNVYSSDQPAP